MYRYIHVYMYLIRYMYMYVCLFETSQILGIGIAYSKNKLVLRSNSIKSPYSKISKVLRPQLRMDMLIFGDGLYREVFARASL